MYSASFFPHFFHPCFMLLLCVYVCVGVLYLLCAVHLKKNINVLFGSLKKRKKKKKDVWMSEREEYCNNGWMFLNKSPTMMCLAKKNIKKYSKPNFSKIIITVFKAYSYRSEFEYKPVWQLLCININKYADLKLGPGRGVLVLLFSSSLAFFYNLIPFLHITHWVLLSNSPTFQVKHAHRTNSNTV